MKQYALLCLSSLVFINLAFAGGQNAPAYSHPKAKPAKAKPAQVQRHHFTGFYVTGEIGGIAGELDAKQNFDGQSFAGDDANSPPTTTFDFSVNDEIVVAESLELIEENVAGAIGIEYAYQFSNGIVLGIAATAGFDNLSYNNTLAATAMPEETDSFGTLPDVFINNIGLSSSLKVEMENDFAILFKPGFVIRENTLVYALVGPRWGNFESSLSTTFNSNGTAVLCENTCATPNGWNETITADESHSEYKIGITAGLGVRQVLTDHFMLGLEYAYTHYDDLDSLQNSNVPGVFFGDSQGLEGTKPTDLFLEYVTNAQDMILNTHTFMATLSYKF